MNNLYQKWFSLVCLLLVLLACNLATSTPLTEHQIIQDGLETVTLEQSSTPTASIPPTTPLPSLTPTRTLLPPPTFEPPTLTPFPTYTPLPTDTATPEQSNSVLNLHGLETPTITPTYVCAPRDDWGRTHTIQPGDYLFNLAQRYGTTVDEIAAANCLRDIQILSVGIVLKMPGAMGAPGVECVPWEVLTPMNGTLAIAGTGTITFNWRGPRSHRNLIRIHTPNGGVYERVIEIRQNETIDLSELPLGGTYTWYIYPLDYNFLQIACLEGGPYTFVKAPAPSPEGS